MKKKNKPLISKAVVCDCKHSNYTPKQILVIALIEDKNLFYFTAFSELAGHMAISCRTQLESVMLFQFVIDGVRELINKKSFIAGRKIDRIIEATEKELKELNEFIEFSWSWIRSQAKSGKKIIQSLETTNKQIFGKDLAEKILNFSK